MSEMPADVMEDARICARTVLSGLIDGDAVATIAAAILAERERCARIAETQFPQIPTYADDVAAAIRKGETK